MKLVLIRHAARHPHRGTDDPELTDYGQLQARRLAESVGPHRLAPRPTALLASPRIRARATLQPMAYKFAVPLIIDEALDERHQGETALQFGRRVDGLLTRLIDGAELPQKTAEVVIWACSHMDWLETALDLLCPTLPANDPGGWHYGQIRLFQLELDGLPVPHSEDPSHQGDLQWGYAGTIRWEELTSAGS